MACKPVESQGWPETQVYSHSGAGVSWKRPGHHAPGWAGPTHRQIPPRTEEPVQAPRPPSPSHEHTHLKMQVRAHAHRFRGMAHT